MQAYDLIMLIVIGTATVFGAIKGFAWQVASLASMVSSYLVAYRFRGQVAEMIHAAPPWNLFLAMLILYVGSSFVIWVGFRLLSGTIDKVQLREFDRQVGAAFGLGKGLIYCLLITMFAMSLLGPKQQSAICRSRSGYYIASALDKSGGILPAEIHDVVGPYLSKLDEELTNGQNSLPTNDPSWANGLPSLQGITDQPTEQGVGSGWNLGQLIPSGLQGAGQPQGNQPPNNFQPNYPPPGNSAELNSTFLPAGNFAPPAGNGFSGSYDGSGTQSAQQPGYALPR